MSMHSPNVRWGQSFVQAGSCVTAAPTALLCFLNYRTAVLNRGVVGTSTAASRLPRSAQGRWSSPGDHF